MISVILPTRQRPKLLHQALASLAAQTYTDFEVLVVNDAGPSLTRPVAAWARQLGLDLILVELPEHRGVSAARNAGIARSQGDLLAFLDDDDIVLPGHLDTAVKHLHTSGDDLVYLGALVAGRRLAQLPDDRLGMPTKAYPYDADFLLVANYIHTGSVVTRSFRDSPVHFDESLTHCEDWDMWLSLTRTLGYRAAFVDALTSIYHQLPHGSGLVADAQRSVPSPFTVVRRRIHAAWPTRDTHVLAFRVWMDALEEHRNQRIAAGLPIPHQMFDAVLGDTHRWFTTGRPPDHARIPHYFCLQEAT
ncbi:glycosyltransferase involved in cell wall biosynthesis [Kitasatospora sp. MAP12-15]|uniref:glycosyltransferase family 2 protein n=1 Tax=unclassified Kitasatospora TaxID=2633591 RepID=UPI002473FF40|nr:glycosyltransferase family A protein [Kitasatospora sp. MAP12-44]MDH6114187.1 glycosyltransferase involved in cell wall biosynthesis [Kitasatospora sp. MAP12-44]